MAYGFYGWQTADALPVTNEYPGISSPRDLYDRLCGIWSADTCAPRMRDNWSPENKTLGQCSITAFLAQDIFGGRVYGILRPDGNYHCYNVIGDCCFDLTSEQFGEEAKTLVYEDNPEQFRKVHFSKEEKRLRYEALKKALGKNTRGSFPDGTPIDAWFCDTKVPSLEQLGKQYVLTEYGILDDGRTHTQEIQALIDRAAARGGGVIVVPAGTYLTGSLYFRQGVNLYVAEGGTLKGSDDISDYPVCDTRIEGESCRYFAALINADGLDGFTMCGPGVIDGNGLRSWKAFWLRRSWNPACTNKDEQRPRLIYISNCQNVLVAGLHLQNAHFWTNHIYRSNHVKYLGCRIFSPAAPVKAPSTDAIDLDVCSDVLVKNCYLEVNDDSVVLKGGKGPWADSAPENGSNERILIEDCVYGFCHGCLTCGSESVHNRNIILRRIRVLDGANLLWLKMRPDTPQHYEYITVEDIEGRIANFININPWTQFYDLKDRRDIPLSYADHIVMKNCNCICDTFFNVTPNTEQYRLSDFTFENLRITANESRFCADAAENMKIKNVRVEMQREEWTRKDGTPFLWCVLLDAGRKYFSPELMKGLMDIMKENGFHQLLFAFGNDGLRFVPDGLALAGMSAGEVREAVAKGNQEYNGDPSYLTGADMDELFTYADEAGIEIVPLLNMPGHMNTAVSLKPEYRFESAGRLSQNSLDVTNEKAVSFGLELLQKYVEYFAAKGCRHFHFGADEYANDAFTLGGLGFTRLEELGKLECFADYVNRAAEIVLHAGMVPMAFNDGIYYADNTDMHFNPAIEVCYWGKGWIGFNCAKTETIEKMGNPLINTNGAWYYVLKHEMTAQKPTDHPEFSKFDVHEFPGGQRCGHPDGAVFCIWCDESGLLDGAAVMKDAAEQIAAVAKQLRSHPVIG